MIMSNIKKYLIVIFLLSFSFLTYAETNQVIEKNLIGAVDKLNSNTDDNETENLNLNLAHLLTKYAQLPQTLQYNFPALSQKISIVTSADQRVRAYNWDTNMGGSAKMMAYVEQFRSENGAVIADLSFTSQKDRDSDGIVCTPSITGINFFDTPQNKRIYVISTSSVCDIGYYSDAITLYEIKGAHLVPVNLIKAKSGFVSTLSQDYDQPSISDKKIQAAWNKNFNLFSFDEKNKEIIYPQVVDDKQYQDGRVTNKLIRYQFDGKYFIIPLS